MLVDTLTQKSNSKIGSYPNYNMSLAERTTSKIKRMV